MILKGTFLTIYSAFIFNVNARGQIFSESIGIYLENVSELGVDTTEINFRNSKWNFVVERIGDDVSVFLEPIGELDWSYSASIELESEKSGKSLEQHFGGKFENEKPTKIGSSTFISWSEFINEDNKFVVDNVASFNLKFNFVKACGCCSGGWSRHR